MKRKDFAANVEMSGRVEDAEVPRFEEPTFFAPAEGFGWPEVYNHSPQPTQPGEQPWTQCAH